jgi:hypothetical protein
MRPSDDLIEKVILLLLYYLNFHYDANALPAIKETEADLNLTPAVNKYHANPGWILY